jgi:ribosomal protein S18 acetylase RimI-like enzyme
MAAEWWERDRRALEAALALYWRAFERSRIPDERVRSLLETGAYRLALVRDGAAVQALMLVAVFPDERFSHLDYIVTEEPARRRGLASELVRLMLDDARARGFDACTLETEDPMVPFYAKRGARKLGGVPYLFPSPGHGPISMHLMAWPLAGQERLPRGRAETIVRALYRGIHRRGEPDPILGSIVERIPESVELVG